MQGIEIALDNAKVGWAQEGRSLPMTREEVHEEVRKMLADYLTFGAEREGFDPYPDPGADAFDGANDTFYHKLVRKVGPRLQQLEGDGVPLVQEALQSLLLKDGKVSAAAAAAAAEGGPTA